MGINAVKKERVLRGTGAGPGFLQRACAPRTTCATDHAHRGAAQVAKAHIGPARRGLTRPRRTAASVAHEAISPALLFSPSDAPTAPERPPGADALGNYPVPDSPASASSTSHFKILSFFSKYRLYLATSLQKIGNISLKKEA